MIENRTMSRDELDTVLTWAATEGWNPGLEDADAFFTADPKGFFVAVEDGTPVAAISVVCHSAISAFLGLYLCKPAHRGRGIGYALWTHAMAHAGDRTVALDGVPDQQRNYERSGFIAAGGTTRFEGQIAPRHDPHVRLATASDIPDLIEREAAASGWTKPVYLSNWFRQCDTRRTFILEDDTHGTAALTVRACAAGAKIGPLVADTVASADRLIRHTAQVFDSALTLDVPNGSAQLGALCREYGMTPGFETARMYKGAPPVQPEGIYSVATLELG
ncbi:MAG: GNAT family N-acetyltransferase [Roseobacter sp.]